MTTIHPFSNPQQIAKTTAPKERQNNTISNPDPAQAHDLSLWQYCTAGKDLVKPIEVIKAGDSILENAYNAQTKPGSATFTLAKGDEVFPNIWDNDGGYYYPKQGDIILGYGEVPKDWGISNPDVLAQMEEEGLLTYPDRAVSAEPDIMYETYLGADGRNFEQNPLQYGETVAAEKKIFPVKFMFAKPATMVETLEAKEGSGSLAKVGEFQYIQIDTKGNPYVKDIKDLTKRLNPTDEESAEVFDKIKSVIAQRSEIQNDENTTQEAKKAALSQLWSESLDLLIK